MEPIYIFTLTGAFAMGAALSARQVSHDIIDQAKLNNADAQIPEVTVPARYLFAGNLAAVALIVSLVYGGQNFAWWIPVSSLVVSFPAIYYIFLRRILKATVGSLVYAGLALIGMIPMIQQWVA